MRTKIQNPLCPVIGRYPEIREGEGDWDPVAVLPQKKPKPGPNGFFQYSFDRGFWVYLVFFVAFGWKMVG